MTKTTTIEPYPTVFTIFGISFTIQLLWNTGHPITVIKCCLNYIEKHPVR